MIPPDVLETLREDDPCPVCRHLMADHDDQDLTCGECRDWGGPCEP